MYLIDFSILIKQLMPPHWRDTYRETILGVLIAPLKWVYDDVLSYRREVLDNINLNAQTQIVEDLVNRKYAMANYRLIQIVDDVDACTILVNVHIDSVGQNLKIKQEIKKYLPLGYKMKLVNYNS